MAISARFATGKSKTRPRLARGFWLDQGVGLKRIVPTVATPLRTTTSPTCFGFRRYRYDYKRTTPQTARVMLPPPAGLSSIVVSNIEPRDAVCDQLLRRICGEVAPADSPSSRGAQTNRAHAVAGGHFVVLPERIELSTSPLPRGCSTTELRQQGMTCGPVASQQRAGTMRRSLP